LKSLGRSVIATTRQASPPLEALSVRVETDVEVTDDASVAGLARRLEGVVLDELICNAGILREDDLDRIGMDGVRDQIEVNAIGPLRVVKAMRRNIRRGGKLALITSRMGSIGDNGSGGYYGYRMSKAALNAAGMSLARDLRSSGIAVAILHPGAVRHVGPHGTSRTSRPRCWSIGWTLCRWRRRGRSGTRTGKFCPGDQRAATRAINQPRPSSAMAAEPRRRPQRSKRAGSRRAAVTKIGSARPTTSS
jgi:NAD(P)-dependent dehydrogenase (short-subunit alcohol dehydrogenase family)